MVRLRNLVLAAGLALGALAVSPPVPAADTYSKAVGVPLKAADEAIKAKKMGQALEHLREADAAPGKKAHEQFAIDQLMGYVLYAQKNFAEAAPVYERLIESGRLPPPVVAERTKAVAQMYFQMKNYPKAIAWAQKSLALNPAQQDMQVQLGQAYYLGGNYKNASDSMMKLVVAAERNGQVPKEPWLRVVQASQLKMGPREKTTVVMEKLVRYYGEPQDWDMLLNLQSQKDHPDGVTLGFYRLMLDVNVLKDPDDYVEAAQLAMDAQVPALARSFVDKGMQNGALKTTEASAQARYKRLTEGADKRIVENKTRLDGLAKTAPAAAQGEEDALLGRMYASYGRNDEAIAALERGLKKSGIADPGEARVELGIAYLRKGEKDKAAQAFRAVPKNSPWADLAGLWGLRL